MPIYSLASFSMSCGVSAAVCYPFFLLRFTHYFLHRFYHPSQSLYQPMVTINFKHSWSVREANCSFVPVCVIHDVPPLCRIRP
ncbi:hypothetical protein V8E52_010173 [Russula decolorans]